MATVRRDPEEEVQDLEGADFFTAAGYPAAVGVGFLLGALVVAALYAWIVL